MDSLEKQSHSNINSWAYEMGLPMLRYVTLTLHKLII